MEGNHKPVHMLPPGLRIALLALVTPLLLIVVWQGRDRGVESRWGGASDRSGYPSCRSLDSEIARFSRLQVPSHSPQPLGPIVGGNLATTGVVPNQIALATDFDYAMTAAAASWGDATLAVSRPVRPGESIVASAPLIEIIERRINANAINAQQTWSLMSAYLPREFATRAPSQATRRPMLAGVVSSSSDRLAMRLEPPQSPDLSSPRLPSIFSLFSRIPLNTRSPFATPTELEAMVANLAMHPELVLWARDVEQTIDQLTDGRRLAGSDSTTLIERMVSLAAEADTMAANTHDEYLAMQLRRVHWGLLRRAGCWSVVDEIYRPHLQLAGDTPLPGLTVAEHSTSLAVQPIRDVAKLSASLEAYESTREPAIAKQIALRCQLAQVSDDPREQQLADQLTQHYRNANLRIALSYDLLQRLTDPDSSTVDDVDEYIGGTPVRGVSRTNTSISTELLPDEQAWRLGIQLTGETNSRTRSFSPPVILHSLGHAQFAASKQLVIDHDGIRRGPTSVVARANSQLRDLMTDYDDRLIISRFIRNRALSEYSQRKGIIRREIEQKTASRVSTLFDQQIEETIAKAESQYNELLDEHLGPFGVSLQPIQLQTTDQRLVGRFRVAADDQLAAHTPRPRALSDSLLSVQVHESMATNMAAGIDLDGASMTLTELREHLSEKLPSREDRLDGQDDRNISLQFADDGAITCQFIDGQAKMVLSVKQLQHGRRTFRNFRVHLVYKPTSKGLTAQLVHADGPHIEGKFRNADRFHLHGIFAGAFGEDRHINLLPDSLASDPRLKGLMVTQLVIHDGWLAMSLGPETDGRIALQERVVR